jgi:hypothetical protein
MSRETGFEIPWSILRSQELVRSIYSLQFHRDSWLHSTVSVDECFLMRIRKKKKSISHATCHKIMIIVVTFRAKETVLGAVLDFMSKLAHLQMTLKLLVFCCLWCIRSYYLWWCSEAAAGLAWCCWPAHSSGGGCPPVPPQPGSCCPCLSPAPAPVPVLLVSFSAAFCSSLQA